MIRQSPLVSAFLSICLRTANLLFMAYGTRDLQHSIRTAATRRRQLTIRQSPLLSTVRANCENLLFMAFGTRDFQHSIRTAATKRRQPYHSPISRRLLFYLRYLFVRILLKYSATQSEILRKTNAFIVMTMTVNTYVSDIVNSFSKSSLTSTLFIGRFCYINKQRNNEKTDFVKFQVPTSEN